MFHVIVMHRTNENIFVCSNKSQNTIFSTFRNFYFSILMSENIHEGFRSRSVNYINFVRRSRDESFDPKEASSRENGTVKSVYSDSRAKRRSLPLVKITYVSRE